jgi:hypothetical protein
MLRQSAACTVSAQAVYNAADNARPPAVTCTGVVHTKVSDSKAALHIALPRESEVRLITMKNRLDDWQGRFRDVTVTLFNKVKIAKSTNNSSEPGGVVEAEIEVEVWRSELVNSHSHDKANLVFSVNVGAGTGTRDGSSTGGGSSGSSGSAGCGVMATRIEISRTQLGDSKWSPSDRHILTVREVEVWCQPSSSSPIDLQLNPEVDVARIGALTRGRDAAAAKNSSSSTKSDSKGKADQLKPGRVVVFLDHGPFQNLHQSLFIDRHPTICGEMGRRLQYCLMDWLRERKRKDDDGEE